MVWPRRRERVEIVNDSEHPSADRDRLASQSVGIARSVPSLVVALNDRGDGIGERNRFDDFGPDDRMNANARELFWRQTAGLRQDVLGYGELADVVEQCRNPHGLD